nr:MAG TPA: tail assembly chaperone protein [Caudoviricetes sp.]
MPNFRPTTEIDLVGHNFIITHWSPMVCMHNLPKIGRIIAVPMGAIGGELLNGGRNLAEVLPTALVYLFEQLDDQSIDELFKILFSDVTVDGVDKVDPDKLFTGNLFAMLKLAGKVLEVNYGSFFTQEGLDGLMSMLQGLQMANQINSLDQETQE